MLHWIRYLSTLDSKEMDIKWHVWSECTAATWKSSLQLRFYAVKGPKLTSGQYSLYTHTLKISEHFLIVTVSPVKAQQFLLLFSTACFGLYRPYRVEYKIEYICMFYIESRSQHLTICIVMWVHTTRVALGNRICIPCLPVLIVLNKGGSRMYQYKDK